MDRDFKGKLLICEESENLFRSLQEELGKNILVERVKNYEEAQQRVIQDYFHVIAIGLDMASLNLEKDLEGLDRVVRRCDSKKQCIIAYSERNSQLRREGEIWKRINDTPIKVDDAGIGEDLEIIAWRISKAMKMAELKLESLGLLSRS